MSFMESIGSFFAGGADDAAVKAGAMKAQGYGNANIAIGEGETKALGYANDATARFDPIYKTGTTALAKLADLYGLNGSGAAQTAASDFVTSPGYDFRVSEGAKALDRGAAAKGGIYSGAAGKALVRFGQNAGSDEYGKWTAGITGLAGQAMPAATGQASTDIAKSGIATNAANSRAAALIGQNGALAEGEIGRANAVTGGINNAIKIGGMLVGMATGNPMAATGGGGLVNAGGLGVPNSNTSQAAMGGGYGGGIFG